MDQIPILLENLIFVPENGNIKELFTNHVILLCFNKNDMTSCLNIPFSSISLLKNYSNKLFNCFMSSQHGGIVIHVLVAIFTFLGLAIVCDDYFVSSLDRICEEMKLSPDVAGAT